MASATSPISLYATPKTAGRLAERITHAGDVDIASTSSGNDVLGTDVTPKWPGGTLRITIQLAAGGVLYVYAKKTGRTSKSLALNGGSPLTANCCYAFDVPAVPDTTYNLRLGTTGAIDYLSVQEISGGES